MNKFLMILLLLTPQAFASTKVLIIGDSISIGYHDAFQRLHSTTYSFEHNYTEDIDALATNARGTSFGVSHIDEWLRHAPSADMIVYNQGMWDMCGADGVTPTDVYEDNLNRILPKIMATGAKIVILSASYAPPKSCRAPVVLRYNRVLERLAIYYQLYYLDFYSITKQYEKYLQNHDGFGDVHFTEQGYDLIVKDYLIKVLDNQ